MMEYLHDRGVKGYVVLNVLGKMGMSREPGWYTVARDCQPDRVACTATCPSVLLYRLFQQAGAVRLAALLGMSGWASLCPGPSIPS